MRKLKFDVYIGQSLVGAQNEKIIAKVIPCEYIPHGECNVDGSRIEGGSEYFYTLYALGTYFADWTDLLQSENIIAIVYLNNISLKKMYHGKEIVKIIDKINQKENIKEIKSFNEI